MGIISEIKKLFKNRIDASDIEQQSLISLVSEKKLKLGKVIDVPKNFVAVLVAKGKVADCFVEGTYRLETSNMPILSRVLKLSKPDKKGNMPTHFKAEIYYINLNEISNQDFCSEQGVRIKDKLYKSFDVKLFGTFSYQIFNAVDFVEALLTQYGVLRDVIAKQEIGYWVGRLADRKVQKNKPSAELLFERATVCFDGLIDYVNKELFDCGVKLSNIDVTETRFPKRIYKSVSLSYKEMQNQHNNDGTAEVNPVQRAMEVDFQNNSNKVYHQQAMEIESQMNQKTYVLSNQTEQQIEQQDEVYNSNNIDDVAQNADIVTDVQVQNLPEKEKSEDDGNVNDKISNDDDLLNDEVITKTLQYVKCPKCGSLNSKNSKHCFSCKTKL